MRKTLFVITAAVLVAPVSSSAQRPDSLSERTREYVSVDAAVVALTNVLVIDGTGAPARANQTVLIENGRIAAVGTTGDVVVPAGAEVLDLSGHTVFPGMVGLHNHLFYMSAGGRGAQLTFSAPRLYLAAGVTTVRTTGSRAPYAEINLKNVIDRGCSPGPRIHITAPYITGGQGITTMTLLNSPEQARRFVAYWAEEGATWLKAYTNVGRAELAAAIDEAHKHGMKVTGHLCSVSFTEAVELGIDNLEHEQKPPASLAKVITWIVVMNLVFSFDSILSAMALTDVFSVMATAIVIGGVLMICLSDRMARFLQKNRLYEVLGLFILFVVGIMLLSEGGHLAHLEIAGHEITPMSRATFYFVIGVMVLTDVVQNRYQRKLMAPKHRAQLG